MSRWLVGRCGFRSMLTSASGMQPRRAVLGLRHSCGSSSRPALLNWTTPLSSHLRMCTGYWLPLPVSIELPETTDVYVGAIGGACRLDRTHRGHPPPSAVQHLLRSASLARGTHRDQC